MPKQEINYNNTIIYKIVCKDLNIQDLYIGHTTNFIKRKNAHRKCSTYDTKKNKMKIYETIKLNGGWDNWDMIEIEKYPCNDGNEARARERDHYENQNTTLNMRNPSRNPKEYYQDNKDILDEKNRIHYQKTKEYYLKKFECECGGSYTHKNRSKHFKTDKHQKFINEN